MLRVGLTGGIAAGKSTVAGRLADLGAVVIDADAIAREVVRVGSPGLAALVSTFGPQVLLADGSLDRAALGRRVFTDDSARELLNAITHPLISARTHELLEAADRERIVVHDVPLLVENHLGPDYHLAVVVHAGAEERVERLRSIRGLSEADAWARIQAQADDEQRRKAADVWLDSGQGLQGRQGLLGEVDRLWRGRLVPFDAHVLEGTRAARGQTRVVPYRPTWPDDARRLTARIRRWAGNEALAIEHIGSTAVPGLAAKDVIDLQITVPDLTAADSLEPLLERVGFVRVPGLRDNPHPSIDPDPAAWQKRFHASTDPGRPVNVHVRAQCGPGARVAVLLRDWLRADGSARREYLVLKQGLASRGLSGPEYAMAKEPWMNLAVPRAQAWEAAGRPTAE